ncbi:MAG: hypothetical protein ACMXYG_02465 [Candidatus Woesearchaeota archaeon]
MNIAKNPALYNRIVQAIPIELKGELDKTLENYNGDPALLGLFLDRFGSDNPWEATQNAHLKQAIFRYKGEEEQLAVSESGHKLKRQLFVMCHNYDPTRTWTSGGQAITKIMETFGDEKQRKIFTSEGQEEIRNKKSKQTKKTIEELPKSLEDLLQDPSKIKDLSSIKARQDIHALLGINEEIKARLMQLDQLVYGNTAFIDIKYRQYLLAADMGGQFWTRFEREKEKLPKGIRDIYTTITNPFIEIDEKERPFMMAALFAYSAMNHYVERNAIIGTWQKDLTLIMNLPNDHEIINKFGMPDVSSIRTILESSEINLMDAMKVFNIYPVNLVRKEINGQYYAQFQEQISSLIKKVEPLFKDDNGKYYQDCYSESVPLQRIKKSIYFSALNRDNFEIILHHIKSLTNAKNNIDEVLESTSIEDFKQIIDSLTISARKVRYMESSISKDEIQNIYDCETISKDLKKEMLRGNKYDLIENFEQIHGISVQETIKRYQAIFPHDSKFLNGKNKVKKAAEYGLYEKEGLLDSIVKVAKKIIPIEKEKKDKITKFKENPLVIRAGTFYEDKDYLREHEIKNLDQIIKSIDTILEEIENNPDNINRIEKMGEISKRRILTGSLTHAIDFNTTVYMKPSKELNGIMYVDVKRLDQDIDEYICGEDISDELIQQITFLISRDAEIYLPKLNIRRSTRNSWSLVQQLQRNKKQFAITKSLKEKVEKLYGDIYSNVTYNNDIVDENNSFREANLSQQYNISITGTTPNDGSRMKSQISKYLNFDGNNWILYKPFSKAFIVDVINKVETYNSRNDTQLRVKIV